VGDNARAATVTLMLAFLGVASPQLYARDQGDAPRDYQLIETTVRQEWLAAHIPKGNAVCLELEGHDPDRGLLQYLASHRMRIARKSHCVGGGRLPHGFLIAIGRISRLSQRVEVEVETVDDTLKVNDFGVIVRKGSFTLEPDRNGNWQITGYRATGIDLAPVPGRGSLICGTRVPGGSSA